MRVLSQSPSHPGVSYRTRLLNRVAAERFARCLAANERFDEVDVIESGRAKGDDRFFVSFLPSRESRIEEMLASEQDARAIRAGTEGQDYVFVADRDSARPFAWCHNPHSGETYEVTLFDCSCPDFHYRCRGVGIRCKHMLALSVAVEAGRVEVLR